MLAGVALYGAPLCPAGHLPHEGGDWLMQMISLIAGVANKTMSPKLLIAPLVGEMSGRTEGGAKGRGFSSGNLFLRHATAGIALLFAIVGVRADEHAA